ncbi:MAG: hypothetical protein ACM3KR_02650 [Deltaproteobacteria bacterium]
MDRKYEGIDISFWGPKEFSPTLEVRAKLKEDFLAERPALPQEVFELCPNPFYVEFEHDIFEGLDREYVGGKVCYRIRERLRINLLKVVKKGNNLVEKYLKFLPEENQVTYKQVRDAGYDYSSSIDFLTKCFKKDKTTTVKRIKEIINEPAFSSDAKELLAYVFTVWYLEEWFEGSAPNIC